MHPSPCSSPCDPPTEAPTHTPEAGLTTAALTYPSILGTPMLLHQCRLSIHSTFYGLPFLCSFLPPDKLAVFLNLKYCAGRSSMLGPEEGLHSFSMILSGQRAHSYKTAFKINLLLYILSICMKLSVCFSKLSESARAHKRPLYQIQSFIRFCYPSAPSKKRVLQSMPLQYPRTPGAVKAGSGPAC